MTILPLVFLANKSDSLKRMKLIDLIAHFVQETVASGQATVINVNSDDHESDGFTIPHRRTFRNYKFFV